MEELGLADDDCRFAKLMAGHAKIDLLILDDWGLAPFTAAQRCDILELLDDHYGSRSTLVNSQMPVDKWHALIGDPILDDTILDRLVHNALGRVAKCHGIRTLVRYKRFDAHRVLCPAVNCPPKVGHLTPREGVP